MKKAQLFILLSGLCVAHAAATRHYQFVRRMKSWLSARKFCRDKYIDLASVHSLDQNDKLHRLLAKASVKNAWIGLFDDSALWKWSLDGAVFNNSKDYSFWRPDSPQRTTGISSCVTVSPQGYWRDAKCTVVFPSVCYNKTGPTKYIFINNTKTFYRAKLHCKALHSGLASIRNQTEQDLVTDVLTRRAWIGLNRRRFQLWSNSQYVKYTNWDGVQPDLPKTLKRRCGLVSATSGKWSEEGCGKEHHFICEKPSRVHKVKLKMKFQSSADMNDPEVIRQIRQQIHARLKNVTSGVRVRWVAADGPVLRKEQKDQWEQSNTRC